MIPAQLTADIARLRESGQSLDVIEDGSRYLLVLTSFRLPEGRYQIAVADLLVIADYQYPMSRMDMFWTIPTVLLPNGALPNCANSFEVYGGRQWQRWSWHYPSWNPKCHNLMTHVEVCRDRLAKGN